MKAGVGANPFRALYSQPGLALCPCPSLSQGWPPLLVCLEAPPPILLSWFHRQWESKLPSTLLTEWVSGESSWFLEFFRSYPMRGRGTIAAGPWTPVDAGVGGYTSAADVDSSWDITAKSPLRPHRASEQQTDVHVVGSVGFRAVSSR